MYQKKYHIHFVGIGGIGMSGIAELLLNLGYRVSGSDLSVTDITQRLARLGGTIYQGHGTGQVQGADVVVTSSAVKADNPEVLEARQSGIPVIPRAEMLAELMRLKYSVAVAGSHGKTTTTSIIAALLEKGGLDPTVVIGGKLKSVGSNAVLGGGEFIVAEADESDGSFLKMAPTIAVVTNIDREHLDFYPDLQAVQAAFLAFIDRIPFYGRAVLCLDDEPIQNLIPEIQKPFVTYGLSTQADLQARHVTFQGLTSRFDVEFRGEPLGNVVLNLPGIHNVYNALAAIAVGLELDLDFKEITHALETLQGVQRRMEVKGTFDDILVMDDYGHHPTEIKATLSAVRESWPDRRHVVVFQPHRFSRTRALFDEFSRAFYQSDLLVMLPVYSAGEAQIPGVDAESLCRAISTHGHKETLCVADKNGAQDYLKKALKPGDLLLTLGAGDVWKVGMNMLSYFEQEAVQTMGDDPGDA
jgi:UDP-N-acetylmuramate--alanine ligase